MLKSDANLFLLATSVLLMEMIVTYCDLMVNHKMCKNLTRHDMCMIFLCK